jgi:transcriptional regulator with XRE-family HTH domain
MPDSLPVLFGRVVRRRREAAGWSQEKLAGEVEPELTRNYIGMIERGETNPTLEVMASLAVAFGTTVSALIQEAEDARTAKAKPRSDKKKA